MILFSNKTTLLDIFCVKSLFNIILLLTFLLKSFSFLVRFFSNLNIFDISNIYLLIYLGVLLPFLVLLGFIILIFVKDFDAFKFGFIF